MIVYGKSMWLSRKRFRAALLGGRNPTKRKPLEGRPLAERMVVAAQGPGTGITGIDST